MERIVVIPPIVPMDTMDAIEHGATLLLKGGNLRRTPVFTARMLCLLASRLVRAYPFSL
jgi:hypothetical protein